MLTKKILDLLFPNYCLGCKKLDYLLCNDCSNQIPYSSPSLCPYCLNNSESGLICNICCEKRQSLRINFLDGLFYLQIYDQNSLVIKALFELKYEFRVDFAFILAEMWQKFYVKFLRNKLMKKQIGFIVTVPSNLKKVKQRGFDHLKNILEKWKEIAPENFKDCQAVFLKKNRQTSTQQELNYQERLENLKDVFELDHDSNELLSQLRQAKNKNILILDDVATSLSTLNEITKVLKNAGFNQVYALVLARQIKYN